MAAPRGLVAAIADDIAYNHHDPHDGLRAELSATDDLAELPILDIASPMSRALFRASTTTAAATEALRRGFFSACWSRT